MPNQASFTQRVFTFGLAKLCDGGEAAANPVAEAGGSNDSHSLFRCSFCCSLCDKAPLAVDDTPPLPPLPLPLATERSMLPNDDVRENLPLLEPPPEEPNELDAASDEEPLGETGAATNDTEPVEGTAAAVVGGEEAGGEAESDSEADEEPDSRPVGGETAEAAPLPLLAAAA